MKSTQKLIYDSILKKLLILLFLNIAFSCGSERVYDLDLSDVEKLTFQELPIEVSDFIIGNIDNISNSQKDLFYSTDSSLDFTYGRGGVAKNWFGSINSNYHHFFVDGVHYKIKGNRGHPFILHRGLIYFCELNLNKDNFKERSYFWIELTPN